MYYTKIENVRNVCPEHMLVRTNKIIGLIRIDSFYLVIVHVS